MATITIKARNNAHPKLCAPSVYVPRCSMSTRLICVVAHVRVNALGGCVYSHDHTSCTVCMHVHMLFGVKHTVLIPVKKTSIGPKNARVLNSARAQNNARFSDALILVFPPRALLRASMVLQ